MNKKDIFNLSNGSLSVDDSVLKETEDRLKKQEVFSAHHLQLFLETLSALARDREQFRKLSVRVDKLYKFALVFSSIIFIFVLILLYLYLVGI